MSFPHEPAPATPSPESGSPAPARSGRPGFFGRLGQVFSALSKWASLLFLAFGITLGVVMFINFAHPSHELRERFYTGNKDAGSKIAVIRVEGILLEGFTGYVEKQIDAAARDDQVKAVVLRIVSPGGTITASDQLHRRLNELRQGKNPKHPGHPKPVVVSMGSLAASGGYYIAMIKSKPPTLILVEPSGITGSIGVYASFPNVGGTLAKIGARMDYIKAGDLKAGGSPFKNEKEMPEAEREVWQNMIDHAYLKFLHVIGEARPELTADRLQEDLTIDETLNVRQGPKRAKHFHIQRYLADGGIYTADQAVQYKLVDKIGYLDDAIGEAAKAAGLGPNEYKAVVYDRPETLLGALLGIREQKPPLQLSPDKLAAAASPRLWFLASQHELAGLLATLGE